jgi:putative ABC transport system permease protein
LLIASSTKVKIARVVMVWQTLLSHYRQHPAQGIFLLTGLSLGVAILLGTLIVSDAAKSSFMAGQKVLGGQVVATIHPLNGNKSFSQDTYTTLRKNGFTDLMPQVGGKVRLQDGRFISILGMDAFAMMHHSSGPDSNTRQSASQTSDNLLNSNELSLLAFSFPPYQSIMAASYAATLGVKIGDKLTLADGSTLSPIKVVSDDLGFGYTLLCDLSYGQKILALPERLTSIALTALPAERLTDSTDPMNQLKSLLPDSVTLTMAQANQQNQALGDAFFINITAVSFLAFLVGCFIAFNAVRFAVLQRLEMVKQLRLTGVMFNEIALALILELLTWALAASVTGGLLGWLLAQLLLPGVGLTLVQLFGGSNLLTLSALHHWWLMAFSIALLGTITATIQPFWQLAHQQPLQTNANQSSSDTYNQSALVLLILGCLLTQLEQSQTVGFVITACWFIGGALLVPGILLAFYSALSRLPGLTNSAKLHWAITDGKANHARLSIAMMAFAVAIAAGIAVTTMVSSFRTTLVGYLDQTLSESLYLQPNQSAVLPIKQYLDKHPDVAMAYRYLYTQKTVENPQRSASTPAGFSSHIRGMTNHPLRHNSIALEKQVANPWQKLHQRQGILINQTLAFVQQLKPGDKLTLSLQDHPQTVEVLGVYFSYGSTANALIIDQLWLKTLWPKVDTIETGVFMRDNRSVEPLVNELTQIFNLQPHHYIKPQQMKRLALNIFEQTFEATRLLTVFTLLIAAIGIYCACYAAQLNQQRQLTLLKILGINHIQLTGLSLLQLLFNALVACLIALPLGLLVAWASVHIVLQYSFGWHFAIVFEPLILLAILTGAIITALLAGLIPLYSLSRKTVITALRESI